MGAVSSETLLNYGSDGIKIAFSNILGKASGLLLAFVAVPAEPDGSSHIF